MKSLKYWFIINIGSKIFSFSFKIFLTRVPIFILFPTLSFSLAFLSLCFFLLLKLLLEGIRDLTTYNAMSSVQPSSREALVHRGADERKRLISYIDVRIRLIVLKPYPTSQNPTNPPTSVSCYFRLHWSPAGIIRRFALMLRDVGLLLLRAQILHE